MSSQSTPAPTANPDTVCAPAAAGHGDTAHAAASTNAVQETRMALPHFDEWQVVSGLYDQRPTTN